MCGMITVLYHLLRSPSGILFEHLSYSTNLRHHSEQSVTDIIIIFVVITLIQTFGITLKSKSYLLRRLFKQ